MVVHVYHCSRIRPFRVVIVPWEGRSEVQVRSVFAVVCVVAERKRDRSRDDS